MIDRGLCLLLLLCSSQAMALKTDRTQDMSIKSDTGSGSEERHELKGNVEIDQGSLRIRADDAVVEIANGEVSRVVFNGKPATLQQEIEDQGLMRAEATNIEYLIDGDKVILSGNVHIVRPRGSMRSERVIYHIDTGLLDAGSEGSRVEMTIKPKATKN